MALAVLNLSVPVPCIQGSFGKRLLTYQTNVPPAGIPQLLGHDPRSSNWGRLPEELAKIYKHIQRVTDKTRRTATYRYIERRMHDKSPMIGAFPAISIGCTKPLEFVPYANSHQGVNINRAVGELQFNLSTENTRLLLDGLARLSGALELLNSGPEGKAIVEGITFPITIYTPSKLVGDLTIDELGQLFHDFNFLQEKVKQAQAIDLDQSDIYITFTNQLAKQPVFRDNGGVEARAASLGKKSTALVVKPVLLRFVRMALEGGDDRRSLRATPSDKPNLTEQNFDEMLERISAFLSQIAAGMGARFKDHTSIHLLTPAWYALGTIFHNLEFDLTEHVTPEEKMQMVDRIAALDWSRANTAWEPVLVSRGGVQGTQNVLQIVRDACGIPDPSTFAQAEPVPV